MFGHFPAPAFTKESLGRVEVSPNVFVFLTRFFVVRLPRGGWKVVFCFLYVVFFTRVAFQCRFVRRSGTDNTSCVCDGVLRLPRAFLACCFGHYPYCSGSLGVHLFFSFRFVCFAHIMGSVSVRSRVPVKHVSSFQECFMH